MGRPKIHLDPKAYAKEYYREWRKNPDNRAKAIEAMRRYRQTPKGSRKYFEYSLKKRYNITIEQYESMLLMQGNKCAIWSSSD